MNTYLLVATTGFSPKVMLVRAETETEARHLADVKTKRVSEWRVLPTDNLGALIVRVGMDDPEGLAVLLG